MRNSVRQVLRDLEHASAQSLDRASAEALVAEVGAHLDAAIAARMELGDSAAEAERQAVAAFGDVRALVRAMAPSDSSRWFDRRFLGRVGAGWGVLFATGAAGWYLGAQSVEFMNFVLGPMALGLGVLILREGMRARRAQFAPIALLFAGFTLVGAVVQTYVAIPESPSLMAIDRGAAPEMVATNLNTERQMRGAIAEYDRQYRAFLAGSAVAPTEVPTPGLETPVRYGPVGDRGEAARLWRDADRWRSATASLADHYGRTGSLLQERLRRPWIADVPGWLAVSAAITAIPAGITLAISLLGSFVGWSRRRLRSRRQNPA